MRRDELNDVDANCVDELRTRLLRKGDCSRAMAYTARDSVAVANPLRHRPSKEELERRLAVIEGSLANDEFATVQVSNEDDDSTEQERTNHKPSGRFMTYKEFRKRANEQRENQHELVKGWIPSGRLGLISGVGKLGKSTALQDMIVGLATGTPWMGVIGTVQCPIYLLDLENPQSDTDEAICAMAELRGKTENDLDSKLFPGDEWRLHEDVSKSSKDPPIAIADLLQRDIEYLIEKTGSNHGLLIIDTARSLFNRYFTGEWENSANDVRSVLKPLQDLARKTNWAVLVVHHDTKSGTNASGSSDWINTVDFYMHVTGNPDSETSPRIITRNGRGVNAKKSLKYRLIKDTYQLEVLDLAGINQDDKDVSREPQGSTTKQASTPIIQSAIRFILREFGQLKKGELTDAVRDRWTELGSVSKIPSKGAVTKVIDSLIASSELQVDNGANNAKLLRLIS